MTTGRSTARDYPPLPRLPVGLTLRENVGLDQYTTIGIGGPARWMVDCRSTEELRLALMWATEAQVPIFVLGGGSNVLVADTGWPGIVIRNCIGEMDFAPAGENVEAVAGGGINWDDFVRESVERNLQGIECLSGIPGTVGAAPVQNIGAYGQEVKETIAWVEAMERSSGLVRRFSNHECRFDYRWSIFKGSARDQYVVTRVAFLLRPGGAPSLRYGDITRYFTEQQIDNPTLAQVREAVLEIRKSKGMVIDAEIADSRSCGSFFMNPIVNQDIADNVEQIATSGATALPGASMPRYPAGPRQTKLSAAWLIERAGFQKGHVCDNAGLSSRHVLAIINRGGARAADVTKLVSEIQQRVLEKFFIKLQPEPVFVGFEDLSAPGQNNSEVVS